eukprot:SM000002S05544  [mRNA]  locus=s2:774127:786951:+ [translate_table: standard]
MGAAERGGGGGASGFGRGESATPDAAATEAVTDAWAGFVERLDHPRPEELRILCRHGLAPLVASYFIGELQKELQEQYMVPFWRSVESLASLVKQADAQVDRLVEAGLVEALEVVCTARTAQERRVARLDSLLSEFTLGDQWQECSREGTLALYPKGLLRQYQTSAAATALRCAPLHLSAVLKTYFRAQLQELHKAVQKRRMLHKGSSMDTELEGSSDGEASPDAFGSKARMADTGLACTTPGLPSANQDMDEERAEDLLSAVERQPGHECEDSEQEETIPDAKDFGLLGIFVCEENDERLPQIDVSRPNEDERDSMEVVQVAPEDGGGQELRRKSDMQALQKKVDEVVTTMGPLWVSKLSQVVHWLRALGLASLSESASGSVIVDQLNHYVKMVAAGSYEQHVLRTIWRLVAEVLLGYLSIILPPSSALAPDAQLSLGLSSREEELREPLPLSFSAAEQAARAKALTEWKVQLAYMIYQSLGDLRVAELFDIIVDYPDSLPAIEDLRTCLQQMERQSHLVSSFRAALANRLLTAGASTADILHHYVSTIRSLRALDRTGVLLEAVGHPIKCYLRRRKDTVRCIMSMLTDDSGDAGGGGASGGVSLYGELGKVPEDAQGNHHDDASIARGDTGVDSLEADMLWEPDPMEADPAPASRRRRLLDTIGLLIGIVGSREVFVNEHRVMLADKLLNKLDNDTNREVRTLELLKLRFGESNLRNCEVMLRDVADSKRINANIKQRAAAAAMSTPAAASGLAAVGLSTGRSRGPQLQRPDTVRERPRAHVPRLRPQQLSSPDGGGGQVPGSPPAVQLEQMSPAGTSQATLAALRARMMVLRDAAVRGAAATPPQGLAPQPPPQALHQEEDAEPLDVLQATIVSALFWPPFQEESMILPPAVERMLQAYAVHYHALRDPRKLIWKKHLGSVRVELEFQDQSAQYVVSPLHAAIIVLFENTKEWSLADLAFAVGVSTASLQRRIGYWQSQGVLFEGVNSSGDVTYTVVENLGGSKDHARGGSGALVERRHVEEDGEAALLSTENQSESDFIVYQQYIMGMLTTFVDGLPIDRIHNMLKMFVADPPYDKPIQQLQAFLAKLVGEEKLEMRDGLGPQHGLDAFWQCSQLGCWENIYLTTFGNYIGIEPARPENIVNLCPERYSHDRLG